MSLEFIIEPQVYIDVHSVVQGYKNIMMSKFTYFCLTGELHTTGAVCSVLGDHDVPAV